MSVEEDPQFKVSKQLQKKAKLENDKIDKPKRGGKGGKKAGKIVDEQDGNSTQPEKKEKPITQLEQDGNESNEQASDNEESQVVTKKQSEKKKKAPKKKEGKEKPEKEKEKKASKNPKKGGAGVKEVPKGKQPLIKEDIDSLLQYMKEMNRPFTLNYLKDNLHLKPAGLGKNLEQLQKNGDITLKEIGASKVFIYNQANIPDVDKEEMDALTQQLDERNDELKNINNENNKLNEQIRSLSRILKLNELQNEVEKFQKKIQDIDTKIQEYTSENFKKSPEEEVINAEQEQKQIVSDCAKKRKIYSGAIDTLLENSEMTVKEFENIVGIYRE